MKASSVALLGGSSLFEKLRKQSVLWLDARYGSGATFVDRSPQALTYNITGATWTAGTKGNCLSFDGADDVVNGQSGDKSKISMHYFDSTFIMLFSVGNATAATIETLVYCGAGGGGINKDGYWLYRPIGTTNRMLLNFSDGTGERITKTFNLGTFNNSLYHLIILSLDRDGLASIYIDNVVSGDTVDISAQPGDVLNTGQIGLFDITSASLPMKGNLMFCGIINRLLSSNERTYLYQYFRNSIG